jgi:dienelactone hydrolase
VSTPTQVGGIVRELTKLEVTLAGGARVHLEALITRPDRPGRVPLVLVNHGSPREPSDRETMAPTGYAAQSLAFARRGYGVAVVMRRGFGWTEGPYSESSGDCDKKDYVGSTRASADDILAALHRLQGESWVDPDRVVLLGQSAGGFAVLGAAATSPKGVVGVISFAGGRGSDVPDHVCQPDRLVAAAAELGKTSRAPSLWVYAKNDHFFDPVLAAQMADAYTRAGGVAELVIAPEWGADGHLLFSRAPLDMWWRHVEPFLAKLALPTEVTLARPAPILAPPATFRPSGRAAFAEYLATEGFEKAFAAGKVAWGWSSGKRTRADAAAEALHRCLDHADDCVVYAVGDEYAR